MTLPLIGTMAEQAAWFFIWIPKEVFISGPKIKRIVVNMKYFGRMMKRFLERRRKENYPGGEAEERSTGRTKM